MKNITRNFIAATITVAALATGGIAGAADLAPVAYKAPPLPVRTCAQFGGFYAGANAGFVSHDWTWNDRDSWASAGGGAPVGSIHGDKSGFNGGIQGGYNYQSGCTVFGVEADWSERPLMPGLESFAGLEQGLPI